jgi:hypothetical protein
LAIVLVDSNIAYTIRSENKNKPKNSDELSKSHQPTLFWQHFVIDLEPNMQEIGK